MSRVACCWCGSLARAGWGTVGAAIEPGEAPQVAAVREAYEETGLNVRIDRSVAALGVRTASHVPEWRPGAVRVHRL